MPASRSKSLFFGTKAPNQRNVKLRKLTFRNDKDLPNTIIPILSFDPGGTTGWSLLVLLKEYRKDVCVFDIERKHVLPKDIEDAHLQPYNSLARMDWFHGQIDCKDENAGIYAMLKIVDAWPSAAVVIESFQMAKPKSGVPKDLLSPERLGAVMKYELALRGRKAFMQTPAFAKSTAPDHRLIDQQIYTSKGNLVHARDADRHTILFFRRCMGPDPKNMAFRAQAFPHLFNDLGEML